MSRIRVGGTVCNVTSANYPGTVMPPADVTACDLGS